MNKRSKVREAVKSKEVQSFANAAMHYCSLLEERDKLDRLEFLKKAHKPLAILYYRAIMLPDTKPASPCEDGMTTDEWRGLYDSIRGKLGDWDSYWDTFNPIEATQETETICSGLADDLADIYSDLQVGMYCWKKGSLDAKLKAVWHWKFSFWIHTGQHINGALRAIFWRLGEFFDEELLGENETSG